MTQLLVQQLVTPSTLMIQDHSRVKSAKRVLLDKISTFLDSFRSVKKDRNQDTEQTADDIATLQWQLVKIQVSSLTVAAFGGMLPVLQVHPNKPSLEQH